MGWAPDQTVTRTRAEAEELAHRVSREAQEHADRFEALARRYSDDAVTRPLGGSLGGVRATQIPDVYVDALAALSPGEVSQVIFTGTSYAILLRRAPPPRENVAGRRVVIRYSGTISADDPTKGRPRDDARARASHVVSLVRARQVPFDKLVTEYSEHADRVFGGDLGTWSTLEPGDYPREVEALSRLKVGDVAEPLDSFWGFQVLQRTDPTPHASYASAAIRLEVDPQAPLDGVRSRTTVERKARTLAATLHADPAQFAAVQAQYDSSGVETWEYGHGSPAISARLDQLRFGEVAEEPVYEGPFFYTVVMRLDPAFVAKAPPSSSYDLPIRVRPDVEAVFHDADSSVLLKHLAEFSSISRCPGYFLNAF
jgi:hypothetical protein